MCCTWENLPSRGLARFLVVAYLSLSGAVLINQPCTGEPSLPIVPQPISWISGPATVSIGRNADLRIPAGYSYTSEKGARAFLEGMRANVPQGVAGVLQPNSSSWWVAFDFSPTGYVKDEDKELLDPDAILKKLGDEMNHQQEKPGSITWERKPDYDPNLHSLEWAVRIGGGEGETVIRQTVRLLARHGVLDAVVTRPARESSDLTPLKDLLKEISFKDGERYADYRAGDKIAAGGLASLVTLGKQQQPTENAAIAKVQTGGMNMFWIGLASVLCVGLVGTVVLVKKINKLRGVKPMIEAAKAVAEPMQTPAAAAQAQVAAPIPSPAARPIAARPVNGNGHKKHHHEEKLKPGVAKANGHGVRSKRKVFNYQKFYTEMMLSGPTPSLTAEVNGYELEMNRLMGHGPAHSHSHAHAAPEPPKDDSSALVSAHSELIANQKTIIEEQKRLIHEQAKLIEEKTRLIAEKNQLLQRQSEMIDNNLV